MLSLFTIISGNILFVVEVGVFVKDEMIRHNLRSVFTIKSGTNGAFTLHGTGNGTGNYGFLYYAMYCTHYTGTGMGTGNGTGSDGFQTHFTTGPGTRP